MEWVTKHDVKLASTFCEGWEPTRAETNRLNFWRHSEVQLQKLKIIDYMAVPIKLATRSVVARNCCAQNLTDHWPVLAYVEQPGKKELTSRKTGTAKYAKEPKLHWLPTGNAQVKPFHERKTSVT